MLLCDVVYAACTPEADARSVTDEDFGRAMAGDAIELATTALLEELVDFFPLGKRRLLQKALAKLKDWESKAIGVAEKKLDDYAKALKADTLRNQADVLDLAARLELGATNAYLGVIPSLGSKDLAKVAARLAADETMHFTVLTNALGRPLPGGALSFGA